MAAPASAPAPSPGPAHSYLKPCCNPNPLPQTCLPFLSHSLIHLGPMGYPSVDPGMKRNLFQKKSNPWIGTYCRSSRNICGVCPLLVHVYQENFNPLAPNISQYSTAFPPQVPGFILAREFPRSHEIWQPLEHHP